MLRVLLFLLLAAAPAAAGPFEPKLVAQVGSDRFRFPGYVQELVVSPDGRRLLAFNSSAVWSFDTATGRSLVRYRVEDETTVLAAAFDRDHVVTLHGGLDDYLVRHHTAAAPRPVHEVKVPLTGLIEHAFSPDGRLLAVVGDKRVTLFDTHTGREVNRIPSPRRGGNATEVRFSADGRRLAVPTDRNTVRVYDCTTGRELGLFKPKRGMECFALSPDGNRITATLDGSGMATLDLRTGVGKTWKATEATDLLFDLGGRIMTADVAASKFQIFDATTGKVVREFKLPAGSETSLLTGTVLGPDGRTLFSASGEGGITAWDLTTNRRLPQSAEPSAADTDVRFVGSNRLRCVPRPEGAGVLTAPETVWDLSTGRGTIIVAAEFGDLSPSGLWRADYRDNRVTVTNTTTGKIARTLPVPPDAQVQGAWFRDGDRRVCVETADAVPVWNLATNQTRRVPVVPQQNVLPSVRTAGRWFGAWAKAPQQENEDTVLRVFDLDTGRPTFDLRGHLSDQLLFTPDGSRLIRCRNNQDLEISAEPDAIQTAVEVFDAATGRLIRTVSSAGWQPRAVSPDGRTLLISDTRADDESQVSTLAAVELATGRERWGVPAVKDWFLHGAGFAPDGRRIAVGTSDGFFRVWDATGDRPAEPPDALAAGRLWDDLAGPDAGKAFAAVATLSHVPEVALPLLRAKVPPAAAVDGKDVERWLRDLDSPRFAARRDATRNLRAVATAVRPAMESLLKTTPSPEVRERLTALLTAATRPSAADVRAIRAAETLERIATDPAATAENRASALELLRAWAAGAEGATLTVEANESLNRLGQAVRSRATPPASAPGTSAVPSPATPPR